MRAQPSDIAAGTVRRLPVGAEPVRGGTSFRVWAPPRQQVDVVFEDGNSVPLEAEGNGYFAGTAAGIGAGARYRLRLDGASHHPDPVSRFQPDGVHGASEVVDPSAFRWTDADWRGCRLKGQVISEIHIGTFTPEGTWAAAAEKLPLLHDAGITLVEMMPVAEFPGRFGWGYDGVGLFAPTRLYGRPDDLRRFVDRAHALRMGVLLDVVYNHFGPDGCHLHAFSPDYFTDRYENEWGEALNFDSPGAAGTRDLVVANARYWIEEFHFDGLRLDATQSLHDASPRHVLAEITDAARAAAPARRIVILAENEPQDVGMFDHGIDALWNDDLHHSAMVAATGRRSAYYSDHAGTPQEFISAARHGFLFQGQRYGWQGKRRGTPSRGIAAARFVTYSQNHDQIANSGRGLRLHQRAGPARCRALTALMLLMPGTPMLFQGQEYAASAPFLFFADHRPDLAVQVREGRRDFLRQFHNLADPAAEPALPDPTDPATFAACKLDWSERDANSGALALHRDLLQLRREDAVFSQADSAQIDGAVLAPEAFLLRYGGAGERLVLVNLGADLDLPSFPEPLLAPPAGEPWHLLWSSEHPAYGGSGTPPIETDGAWFLPGRATVVMASAAQ